MTVSTTDLCDQFEAQIHAGQINVLPPVFQHYGQRPSFSGQAVTIKTFEDNTLIKQILENENGKGKVLIIDGGGSQRCALIGGNIAMAAVKNDWVGIVVNGCVRDIGEIEILDIGIRALALHPLRSLRKGAGERDLTVNIQGIKVSAGNWVYVDGDGILISDVELK